MQRVIRACVTVDGSAVGEIGAGLLLLIGVSPHDDAPAARRLAQKCAELRIFADAAGRFDRSLLDTGGAALVVSQFTLFADVRKGRRPSFTDAAPPARAEPLIDAFASALTELGIPVETGRFGASMQVESINDGPVTILIDSDDLDRPRRQRSVPGE
jgi:D-tyrosyl-tRNA(Tyr) deacylase